MDLSCLGRLPIEAEYQLKMTPKPGKVNYFVNFHLRAPHTLEDFFRRVEHLLGENAVTLFISYTFYFSLLRFLYKELRGQLVLNKDCIFSRHCIRLTESDINDGIR